MQGFRDCHIPFEFLTKISHIGNFTVLSTRLQSNLITEMNLHWRAFIVLTE